MNIIVLVAANPMEVRVPVITQLQVGVRRMNPLVAVKVPVIAALTKIQFGLQITVTGGTYQPPTISTLDADILVDIDNPQAAVVDSEGNAVTNL